MNEPTGVSVPGSDADLLNAIRSGDPAPFDLLRARHAAAARYLAGHLLRAPSAAGTAVDQAFTQVLDAIRRGGGPSDAFRPYLLTAIRRAARDRAGESQPLPTDDQQIRDPGQLLIDPAVASLEGSPVAPAFLSLPERWRAVLWHTAIEGATAAEVAPLLGLPAAGVTEVADQARDGLARAYRQLRQAEGEPEPAPLADVAATLREVVAPLVLGEGAAAYLAGLAEAGLAGSSRTARSGRPARTSRSARPARPVHQDPTADTPRRSARRAAAAAATADGAATGAGATAAAGRWRHRPTAQQRGIAAGAVAALAVFGVGGYLLSLGSDGGSVPTASGQAATTGLPAASATAPSTSPVPQPSTGPTSSRPGQLPPTSATPIAASPPPPAAPTHPAPRPSPPGGARRPHAQVTTQVGVYGPWGGGNVAGVYFTIADAGPAATTGLAAYVSLPSGSALMTGGQHGDGHSGWNCQARRHGATCVHAPIAASGHTGALIAVQVTGSAACGQPVRVTVTGGRSAATAQSAGTIQCGSHDHHHSDSWGNRHGGRDRHWSGDGWPWTRWSGR